MAEPHFNIVAHASEQDPQIMSQEVFDAETLDKWQELPARLADAQLGLLVMSHAYAQGAIGANRIGVAEPPYDLAVGAAAGLLDGLRPVIVASGRAQDQELGDPSMHAEVITVNALDESPIRTAGKMAELMLGVTLEPCPSCMDTIDDARSRHNITRVTFGASRNEIANLGIVRAHDERFQDFVIDGRRNGKFNLEVFPFPSRAVRTACLELMQPLIRDINTGEVLFKPGEFDAARFKVFTNKLDHLMTPRHDMRALGEQEAVLEAFQSIL